MVVTQDEIDRFKGLITAGDIGRSTLEQKAMERKRLAEAAQAKRQQIIAIDEERLRNRGNQDVEPDFAQLEAARRSKRLQDEDRDEVKGMNKVILQSRCYNVLGSQIEEKEMITKSRKEDNRKIETTMEIERLRAIKMYEEREQKRIEDRKKGALVIKAQLEEREAERLRQLELKHQEQQLMLRHIEKLKEEDRKVVESKREVGKRLMQDIAVVNLEQIRRKAEQREVEAAEERRILEYVKEKEKREAELAAEQLRLAAEREREVARLRALQEKAQDLQAEADAVRAKRIQDAYVREERAKEKRERERLARMERELLEAREKQRREKEEIKCEEAELNTEEFEHILALQWVGDVQDRRVREEEHRRRLEHQQELKQQIVAMHDQKRLERRGYFEEGRQLRKEKELHDKYMSYIRTEKNHQLEAEGIPEQFRAPLVRKPRDTLRK